MNNKKEYPNLNPGNGMRGSKILATCTCEDIANLFEVSKWTIYRWAKEGLLNPNDFKDIVYKYNNRHLLDKRRKDSSPRGTKGENK